MGATADLPVLHLDRISWRPGWRPRDPEDFLADLDDFLAKPGWVIDGNHPLGLRRRAGLADVALVVEAPASACIWRLVRRRLRYRGRSRPSMADGCTERLRLRFLWYVLRFRSRILPGILEDLARTAPDVEVVFLDAGGVRRGNSDGGCITRATIVR